MVKLNGCIFFIEKDELLQNIIIFVKRSVLLLKKIEICIQKFLKATDLRDKEIPKIGFDYIYLAALSNDLSPSAFKRI